MKKTIAILLSVSCLFGLNSCFKTEEDIFDQSPAQRLNKLTSDYREVLSGSENGWVLQYFASETEQGYPFVMKFDKSGKVTIAGNNSVSTGGVYKEESSTYDFVQDMSVVLTFDTYNEIFHEFSSPQTDGVGHGGHAPAGGGGARPVFFCQCLFAFQNRAGSAGDIAAQGVQKVSGFVPGFSRPAAEGGPAEPPDAGYPVSPGRPGADCQ